MGLTHNAMGTAAMDTGLVIEKRTPQDRVIALAGNPNVGKSTLFNSLTGMNQHTGNWPGKTVVSAQGACNSSRHSYVLVDIPGTYSLMAHSAEEEVARNFLCFGEPDAIVVVCDATCLERNLNLVLQTLEISSRVIVCVNLMDEAKRKHIQIDLDTLSQKLGIPVVGAVAQDESSLMPLLDALDALTDGQTAPHSLLRITYPPAIEAAIALLEPVLQPKLNGRINSRWLSLQLLDQDLALMSEVDAYLGEPLLQDAQICSALEQARALLSGANLPADALKDGIVTALVTAAEAISHDVVAYGKAEYNAFDRRLDRILTSKWTGYPIMILLLAVVFWLTITGANYPSALLSKGAFWLQEQLSRLFFTLHAPDWLHGMLVLGVYRVLAWVVSVMLPPMAIFFPLFTLLEDAGYLPRVAYNLDRPFKRCCACGKQALSMWAVDNGMWIE